MMKFHHSHGSGKPWDFPTSRPTKQAMETAAVIAATSSFHILASATRRESFFGGKFEPEDSDKWMAFFHLRC